MCRLLPSTSVLGELLILLAQFELGGLVSHIQHENVRSLGVAYHDKYTMKERRRFTGGWWWRLYKGIYARFVTSES
jgi:hypothetical protein